MIKVFFGKFIFPVAQSAVLYAANVLHGEKGEDKKRVAIAYVMEKLPVWQWLKPVMYRFLADLIDEAIEVAVGRLKG